MFPILLAVIRQQNELYKAFEKEAIPHMDALFKYAVKMTGNSDDADDLVQETYLRAFRFFASFEKGTNCKAWLFRILKNTFINDYRKRAREPRKVDYDDVENFYENIKPSSSGSGQFEKEMYDNLLDDELQGAITSLPETFRTVIVLCDIEGFTYEEIADFIGCPVGTVRSRLHRGRKELFSKLYNYASNKGYIEKEKELK